MPGGPTVDIDLSSQDRETVPSCYGPAVSGSYPSRTFPSPGRWFVKPFGTDPQPVQSHCLANSVPGCACQVLILLTNDYVYHSNWVSCPARACQPTVMLALTNGAHAEWVNGLTASPSRIVISPMPSIYRVLSFRPLSGRPVPAYRPSVGLSK